MPQISVIVPVYQVENYLNRCVDSILKQSFSDFELILVDDGSPDRCGAICDEYAKKDSRIVVIHQENGGLSAARNAGIDWSFANSDSQWLTFIDSDDWVHPEYLERLLNAAVDCDVSVSVCGYISTAGEEPIIDADELKSVKWEPERFYVEHSVNATIAWGKLYRKECFEILRYPVGKLHEDEFTTYQTLFSQEQLAIIRAPLYYYFYNQTGIMNSAWSPKRLAAYDAMEKQIAFFSEHGFVDAHRYVARRYLMNITERLNGSMPNMTLDAQSIKALKKRKRRTFTGYAKILNPEHSEDAWLLTQLFPIKMKCYWYYRAIKKKTLALFGKK